MFSTSEEWVRLIEQWIPVDEGAVHESGTDDAYAMLSTLFNGSVSKETWEMYFQSEAEKVCPEFRGERSSGFAYGESMQLTPRCALGGIVHPLTLETLRANARKLVTFEPSSRALFLTVKDDGRGGGGMVVFALNNAGNLAGGAASSGDVDPDSSKVDDEDEEESDDDGAGGGRRGVTRESGTVALVTRTDATVSVLNLLSCRKPSSKGVADFFDEAITAVIDMFFWGAPVSKYTHLGEQDERTYRRFQRWVARNLHLAFANLYFVGSSRNKQMRGFAKIPPGIGIHWRGEAGDLDPIDALAYRPIPEKQAYEWEAYVHALPVFSNAANERDTVFSGVNHVANSNARVVHNARLVSDRFRLKVGDRLLSSRLLAKAVAAFISGVRNEAISGQVENERLIDVVHVIFHESVARLVDVKHSDVTQTAVFSTLSAFNILPVCIRYDTTVFSTQSHDADFGGAGASISRVSTLAASLLNLILGAVGSFDQGESESPSLDPDVSAWFFDKLAESTGFFPFLLMSGPLAYVGIAVKKYIFIHDPKTNVNVVINYRDIDTHFSGNLVIDTECRLLNDLTDALQALEIDTIFLSGERLPFPSLRLLGRRTRPDIPVSPSVKLQALSLHPILCMQLAAVVKQGHRDFDPKSMFLPVSETNVGVLVPEVLRVTGDDKMFLNQWFEQQRSREGVPNKLALDGFHVDIQQLRGDNDVWDAVREELSSHPARPSGGMRRTRSAQRESDAVSLSDSGEDNETDSDGNDDDGDVINLATKYAMNVPRILAFLRKLLPRDLTEPRRRNLSRLFGNIELRGSRRDFLQRFNPLFGEASILASVIGESENTLNSLGEQLERFSSVIQTSLASIQATSPRVDVSFPAASRSVSECVLSVIQADIAFGDEIKEQLLQVQRSANAWVEASAHFLRRVGRVVSLLDDYRVKGKMLRLRSWIQHTSRMINRFCVKTCRIIQVACEQSFGKVIDELSDWVGRVNVNVAAAPESAVAVKGSLADKGWYNLASRASLPEDLRQQIMYFASLVCRNMQSISSQYIAGLSGDWSYSLSALKLCRTAVANDRSIAGVRKFYLAAEFERMDESIFQQNVADVERLRMVGDEVSNASLLRRVWATARLRLHAVADSAKASKLLSATVPGDVHSVLGFIPESRTVPCAAGSFHRMFRTSSNHENEEDGVCIVHAGVEQAGGDLSALFTVLEESIFGGGSSEFADGVLRAVSASGALYACRVVVSAYVTLLERCLHHIKDSREYTVTSLAVYVVHKSSGTIFSVTSADIHCVVMAPGGGSATLYSKAHEIALGMRVCVSRHASTHMCIMTREPKPAGPVASSDLPTSAVVSCVTNGGIAFGVHLLKGADVTGGYARMDAYVLRSKGFKAQRVVAETCNPKTGLWEKGPWASLPPDVSTVRFYMRMCASKRERVAIGLLALLSCDARRVHQIVTGDWRLYPEWYELSRVAMSAEVNTCRVFGVDTSQKDMCKQWKKLVKARLLPLMYVKAGEKGLTPSKDNVSLTVARLMLLELTLAFPHLFPSLGLWVESDSGGHVVDSWRTSHREGERLLINNVGYTQVPDLYEDRKITLFMPTAVTKAMLKIPSIWEGLGILVLQGPDQRFETPRNVCIKYLRKLLKGFANRLGDSRRSLSQETAVFLAHQAVQTTIVYLDDVND